jgi:hypothetical protein
MRRDREAILAVDHALQISPGLESAKVLKQLIMHAEPARKTTVSPLSATEDALN